MSAILCPCADNFEPIVEFLSQDQLWQLGMIVEPAPVFAWLEQQQPVPDIVRMPDTGHFFHRRLLDLRGAIKSGVRKNLPPLHA